MCKYVYGNRWFDHILFLFQLSRRMPAVRRMSNAIRRGERRDEPPQLPSQIAMNAMVTFIFHVMTILRRCEHREHRGQDTCEYKLNSPQLYRFRRFLTITLIELAASHTVQRSQHKQFLVANITGCQNAVFREASRRAKICFRRITELLPRFLIVCYNPNKIRVTLERGKRFVTIFEEPNNIYYRPEPRFNQLRNDLITSSQEVRQEYVLDVGCQIELERLLDNHNYQRDPNFEVRLVGLYHPPAYVRPIPLVDLVDESDDEE